MSEASVDRPEWMNVLGTDVISFMSKHNDPVVRRLIHLYHYLNKGNTSGRYRKLRDGPSGEMVVFALFLN